MNDEIAFVQFIHPGVECLPSRRSKTDLIPWNHGSHKRKFLCQPGWYVKKGQLVHDELTFWGEWEPQSRITRIDNPIEDKCLPHVIHHPLLDLDEPWRVIARSGPYLISPRELYECVGDVPNVCFPCAALHDPETGRIAIYYGCADTVTGLAFGYIPEIIEFTKRTNICTR